MEGKKPFSLSTAIIVIEAVAFAVVILIVWIDELIDIPHLFLGAQATPVNWQESIFESVFILIVATLVFSATGRLFARIKKLERYLPICSSCKRIRDSENTWHQMESFLREKSVVEFTHTLCPECREKLYPKGASRSPS
jgi:hypothetical protein